MAKGLALQDVITEVHAYIHRGESVQGFTCGFCCQRLDVVAWI